MKVFVDTNVQLDVLSRREPFYADAARIWSLAESGRIEALVWRLENLVVWGRQPGTSTECKIRTVQVRSRHG